MPTILLNMSSHKQVTNIITVCRCYTSNGKCCPCNFRSTSDKTDRRDDGSYKWYISVSQQRAISWPVQVGLPSSSSSSIYHLFPPFPHFSLSATHLGCTAHPQHRSHLWWLLISLSNWPKQGDVCSVVPSPDDVRAFVATVTSWHETSWSVRHSLTLQQCDEVVTIWRNVVVIKRGKIL